jgi:hypothetical protein
VIDSMGIRDMKIPEVVTTNSPSRELGELMLPYLDPHAVSRHAVALLRSYSEYIVSI